MGYTHGIKWSDTKIKEEIYKIMKTLNINRMPSCNEIKIVTKETSLCNAIMRNGGVKKWANILNLSLSECNTRTGQDAEYKIKSILENKGFKVDKMQLKHPYDLLVNDNIKIDVKISNKYKSDKGWNSYCFNLEKKYPTCDLYILNCNDDNKILIIPSKFLKQTQVCITDKESKYDKFINRWDYIRYYDDFYKSF